MNNEGAHISRVEPVFSTLAPRLPFAIASSWVTSFLLSEVMASC